MKTTLTTRLLEQLSLLVARLTDEEADQIIGGNLTLSLSLFAGGTKTKSLAVTGKKPKAVQVVASLAEAADAIRACQGRQQARDLLKDLALKAGDLKALVAELGRTPTGKKKADFENQIIEIIGQQADARAFR